MGHVVLDAYLTHCDRRGFSPETRKHYRKLVTAWLDWQTLQGLDLDGAGPADIEAFLDSRPNLRTLSARATYLSWLRAFYTWAVDEGLVEKNPTRKIINPLFPDRQPHPISEADLARVLATSPSPQVHVWEMLGAKAGFRCKEMAGVRGDDIDLTGPTAMLRVSNPKGRKQRVVPVPDDVVAALEPFTATTRGYLFPGAWGRGFLCPETVSRTITRHFRSLGIIDVPHALRHRYGTMMYLLTRDLRLVQELMGHSNPATTALYTKVDVGRAASVFADL